MVGGTEDVRGSVGAPRCALHPELIARASPCERCGNFACDACFGPGRRQLCTSCREATGYHPSDDLLAPRQQRYRQWARKNPRLAGLTMMLFGGALVAMNSAMLVYMERYYVMLFPAGLMLAGLGLGTMLTGYAVAPMVNVPWWYWAITAPLTFGGLLAGIALNFLF